jgi:hypothetical protein
MVSEHQLTKSAKCPTARFHHTTLDVTEIGSGIQFWITGIVSVRLPDVRRNLIF